MSAVSYFYSGMVENVWVAVGISSPALSVEELRPLPICWPPFWVRILMSGRVGTDTSVGFVVGRKCVGSG